MRGKERKNRHAKFNRGRWRFIYIKDKLQREITVGKTNKGINRMFKKLKIKIIKKWKEKKKGRRKIKGKKRKAPQNCQSPY